MESLKKNKLPWLWFLSGFGVGFTLISLSHAALPKRATPASPSTQKTLVPSQGTLIREIRGGKINSPDMEFDFARVSQSETRFVESKEQQERLRRATLPRAALKRATLQQVPPSGKQKRLR